MAGADAALGAGAGFSSTPAAASATSSRAAFAFISRSFCRSVSTSSNGRSQMGYDEDLPPPEKNCGGGLYPFGIFFLGIFSGGGAPGSLSAGARANGSLGLRHVVMLRPAWRYTVRCAGPSGPTVSATHPPGSEAIPAPALIEAPGGSCSCAAAIFRGVATSAAAAAEAAPVGARRVALPWSLVAYSAYSCRSN